MLNNSNSEKEIFVNEIRKSIAIEKKKKELFDLVFLCIGTDRMIGDSLGPLVGTLLEEKLEKSNIYNINIYGTLEKNVCYANIDKILNLVKERHPNSCIIAIDSALSSKHNIGKIIVNNEKMHIGRGLNKKKIEIGDISIKAVVGKNSQIPSHNFYILQNMSLNEIIKLSKKVSNGIIEAIKI